MAFADSPVESVHCSKVNVTGRLCQPVTDRSRPSGRLAMAGSEVTGPGGHGSASMARGMVHGRDALPAAPASILFCQYWECLASCSVERNWLGWIPGHQISCGADPSSGPTFV